MHKVLKYSVVLLAVLLLLGLAIWGPERLANYRDKYTLNQIIVESAESGGEGYRYTLSSNEKLYILSKCLDNQVLPESEQSRKSRMDGGELGYKELTGSYAFVINYQGPTEQEIKESEIFEVCNREISELKELGVLPQEVKEVKEGSYSAELYSAIDVLDPRNNMTVWKVSLSTSQQNADKSNRLLDAYVDAQTGKMYEFYVRIEEEWEELEPEKMVEEWSSYLTLEGMTAYESDNPLLETTPYFLKYRFPGAEDSSTVVTVGFYEGINELFLKIS
ncbi:MAG: hypothetical protein IJ379_07315 [Lachnospiraceae bacterium]|nr:hypothetical protein [Lachnospiraceae bacterium]